MKTYFGLVFALDGPFFFNDASLHLCKGLYFTTTLLIQLLYVIETYRGMCLSAALSLKDRPQYSQRTKLGSSKEGTGAAFGFLAYTPNIRTYICLNTFDKFNAVGQNRPYSSHCSPKGFTLCTPVRLLFYRPVWSPCSDQSVTDTVHL